MGLTVNHVFTSPIADGTNTQIVRPSDWNSAHNVVFSQDVVIGGNTQGVSTIAGDKLYLHGGNNVTLSGNGSTVTIIGPTPGAGGGAGTQFSGTNISGTIDTNGISLSVNPGGGAGDGYNVIGVNGAGTNSATTIQFNNGNNVTFGLNAGTITASASYPAQTVDTNKAGTGFTTVATVGDVIVGTQNTNGLNIGVPAFLTTAQPVGAYLTTAALSNHSHNLATTTTNGSQIVVATTNSAGATLAVPAFLTTAQAPGAYLTTARASNDAIGLNTAITQNGVSMTANSSGLSLNFPAFLTTAAQSGHSHNLATTTTNGSQIVIATTNSAGATMAVPPFITTYVGQTTQTQPAGNIAGVGTTFNGTNVSGSMTLNSNGLRLDLSGQGGGVVNQTGPNIAAGTQTATSGTVVFSNANGVTFGLDGQTLTASVNAGGAAPDRFFKEVIQGERLTTIVGLSATNVTNRPLFLPFYMEGTGLAANTCRMLMSFGASSNRSLGGTFRAGLYSLNNSTQMTLLTSNSWSVSSTNSASSASWNGAGWVDFGLGGFTCTAEGRYMLAIQVNPVSANVTWMPVSIYGADNMPVQSRVWSNGATSAMNAQSQFVPFWGAYSTTTGALPDTVGLTQVNGASSQFQFQYYAALKEV